jgi:tetratricopeptide (TPR) repeat protein
MKHLSEAKKLLQRVFLIPVLIFSFQCNPYSLPENQHSPGETAYTVYQEALGKYNAGNFDEAQVLIKKALGMNPGVAYFHELDGDIYRSQNQVGEALKSYDRATALRSNFPEVYERQAEIYIALNKRDDAIRAYKKILANDPTQTVVFLYIAKQYMDLKEYDVALNSLADYNRQKQTYNEKLEPLYFKLRGLIFFRQKMYKEAIQSLTQFNALEPENSECLALLGFCYYGIAEFDRGLEYFNKLIRMDEKNGNWYVYRGIYFFKKKDLNDAEEQFRLALDLNSELYIAHYYLGKIYEERGELETALEELRLYRQHMPATVGEDAEEPVPGILFE